MWASVGGCGRGITALSDFEDPLFFWCPIHDSAPFDRFEQPTPTSVFSLTRFRCRFCRETPVPKTVRSTCIQVPWEYIRGEYIVGCCFSFFFSFWNIRTANADICANALFRWHRSQHRLCRGTSVPKTLRSTCMLYTGATWIQKWVSSTLGESILWDIVLRYFFSFSLIF